MEQSALLHFAAHTLQELALGIMATVYTIRIIWILRFKAGRERQAPTGDPSTTAAKGALYSLMNIAMPWAMESTRKHLGFYLQFVIFHLGVVMGILLSFVIPYAPGLLASPAVVLVFQATTAAACVVGLYRLYRRITVPVMRAISTPDDYFSLAMLTGWFFMATLAAPNSVQSGEAVLLTFFLWTAFFLIYVPFSKIGHYLYYPFSRYYLGRTMGHRGVFPLKRSIIPQPTSLQPLALRKEAINEK